MKQAIDDLQSARRALKLRDRTDKELETMLAAHKPSTGKNYASQVICGAIIVEMSRRVAVLAWLKAGSPTMGEC